MNEIRNSIFNLREGSTLCNSTTTIPTLTGIIAGTSSNGRIALSTDNVYNFNLLATSPDGNPVAFTQLANSDLMYITDTGYAVNYNKSYSNQLASVALTAIHQNISGSILVADQNGNIYISTDDGETFSGIAYTVPGYVYQIIESNAIGVFFITSAGIYFGSSVILKQAGTFSAGCKGNAAGTILYAASSDFLASEYYLWQSTDSGNTWSIIYTFSIADQTISSIVVNDSRVLLGINGGGSAEGVYYSDDDFATAPTLVAAGKALKLIAINNVTLMGSDEHAGLWVSRNNGETWSENTGNPQLGESTINALLKLQT